MSSNLWEIVTSSDSKDLFPSEPTEEISLLLPTKVYPLSLDDVEYGDEFSPLIFQAFPNSFVQWTSQPVVRWVESLAAAAENAELEEIAESATIGSENSRSIEIGGTKMSHRSNPETTQGGPVSHRPFPAPTPTTSSEAKNFDTMFILEQDRQAGSYLQHMLELAGAIEASMKSSVCKGVTNQGAACYKTIHSRLEFTFGRIVSQFPGDVSTNDATMRRFLTTLYEHTIQKLQSLLHSLVRGSAMIQSPSSNGAISKQLVSPISTATHLVGKKDLGTFMTQWLLDNWTNPYPDDEGMVQLARECGVTATVVSNWLINARTRKWRPAIVKATELDRPSGQLLEDSIAIFKGIPLRALGEERPKKRTKTSH